MDMTPARMQRTRVPRYPFLFSLYPVLFLYLRNIREVPWTQALWAAAASLGIALLAWPATRLVAAQAEKRALSLLLFLLLFHTYGLYYGAISSLLPGSLPLPASHALALIAPGGAWLLLNRALARSARTFVRASRWLGLAVLILVAWNLAGILLHHGRALLEPAQQPAVRDDSIDATAGGPDIYCLVMDEYAAIESARSLFQYDNSRFAAALRGLGFFVARDSRSPFLKTEHAFASFLNPGDGGLAGDPFPRIRRNQVVSFLKRRGYRIVEFAASPAMFMEEADQRHYFPLARISVFFCDFYRTLFERSLLRFFAENWSRSPADVMPYYRERVLEVFRKMPAVAKSPGPKFVFVHLYCPHEPFVFDAQGKPVPRERAWDHADANNYLGQYIFTSARMLETAAAILAGSPQPPVIIIQSDHGYRGSRGRTRWYRNVERAEAQKVFNALHLPGVSSAALAPNMSPLNNFRLVLNLYFGTHYPLLPNP